MPPLNLKALKEACRSVSSNTMWNCPNPKGISDIITTEEIDAVIRKYQASAVEIADEVKEVGGDPNVVTRAVDYIASFHAIPPIRDNTRWFTDSLYMLVFLAYPTIAGAEFAHHPIHDDILAGISAPKKRKKRA